MATVDISDTTKVSTTFDEETGAVRVTIYLPVGVVLSGLALYVAPGSLPVLSAWGGIPPAVTTNAVNTWSGDANVAETARHAVADYHAFLAAGADRPRDVPKNSYAWAEPRHLKAEPLLGRQTGLYGRIADAACRVADKETDRRSRGLPTAPLARFDDPYRYSQHAAAGEWQSTQRSKKNHRTFEQVDLRDCDCRGCMETVRAGRQGTVLTVDHLRAGRDRLYNINQPHWSEPGDGGWSGPVWDKDTLVLVP